MGRRLDARVRRRCIPSVVYGLWAIFVLGHFLRDYVEPVLARYLGFIPLFQGPRASDYTAFLSSGDLIEFGDTNRIFTNPTRRETKII